MTSTKSESPKGPISGHLFWKHCLLWSPHFGKGFYFIPTRDPQPLGGASEQLPSGEAPGVPGEPWLPPRTYQSQATGSAMAVFYFYYTLLESTSREIVGAARGFTPPGAELQVCAVASLQYFGIYFYPLIACYPQS